MINKTLHRKLKIDQHKPEHRGWTHVPLQFLLH